MSKVLLGMVTFGNLNFTKLAIQSIKETTTHPLDIFIVVGKPDDNDTIHWLDDNKDIQYVIHDVNFGFPKSVNDIYDFAWKQNDYDYIILAGNDIVAYPGSVDSIIHLADNSDYECISALQYDVRDLTKDFPDTDKYFSGSNKIFTDFNERPWDRFTNYGGNPDIRDMQLYDIQNLCLYKRSLFNKVGYTDVAFYPAYFVDNDYARRIVNSRARCCTVANARFFHFWSRTIHQEKGGSNDKFFKNNKEYYRVKWGGDFGEEKLSPPIKISDRLLEEQIINHWKHK